MQNKYADTQFTPLTFYFSPPYVMPEGNTRASGYGINGTPSVVFDGTQLVVGGGGVSMFNSYDPIVTSELAAVSPLSIAADYVILNGQVDVTADITVDQATSGGNRKVYFFVAQDNLHGHPNMVVAMLPEESFSLTSPGQSVSIQRSFPMNTAWNQTDLRIIVVVQDTVTKEIYQTGSAVPNYAGTLTIDCVPDGVGANWSLSGPGISLAQAGDLSLGLFAVGEYTLTWDPVPYWDAPAGPQVQTLAQDGSVTFTGTYTNGPFAAVTAGPFAATGTGNAVSLIDLDEDGDLDIHLTGGAGNDQVLRNDGATVFTELTGSPLAAATATRGAAWADINDDGHLDVCLTRYGQANEVYLGDGLGGFNLATTYPGGDPGDAASASWVDYNLDGKLDLAIVNEGSANILLAFQQELAPGILLFNGVTGSFSNTSNGSSIAWGDGDLDGRLDPFLVNRFSSNILFENTAVGFSDLTNGAGLTDLGNGRGAAWGDYDNDGDLDLYLANDGQADRLYECNGVFQYNQVAGTNLNDPGHSRGVIWADFDNDMNLDLYVTRYDEPDLFLLSDGAGGFIRVPVGPDEATFASNAVACGDLNQDGRLDVVISRIGAGNVVFESGMGQTNHWSRLRLTGSGTNAQAIGARVVMTAGGVSQTRLISPGSGYLSSSAVDPHFGLAAAAGIDQIDIYWPDGVHQVVGAMPVDTVIDITEGSDPVVSAVGDDRTPRATALLGAHPNPFNPRATISFALRQATRARVAIYNVEGRLVRVLADESLAAGRHDLVWTGLDRSGRRVASGTYLYRLTTDAGFDRTGSIVMVK